MSFIEKMIERVKKAENDAEIKEVFFEIYTSTQYDSQIRKEFEDYYSSTKRG